MSLFITSLNSGSNGNCYYIGNEQEAILIDAGISCRETEKRMRNLNLSMQLVKAIFISHEHIDHVRGLEVLSRKYKLPVYITAETLRRSSVFISDTSARTFVANEPIIIGELSVIPFAKEHDAIDPCSFIIEGNGTKIGVLTDIGIPCNQVMHYFKQCHAAFLEANYDEQMLERGSYPPSLKKRIRGGKGHLSNRQALELFIKHKPSFMSHLLLSHLSEENNCPELVHKLFLKHAGDTHIEVVSRYKETPVYHISGSFKKFSEGKVIRISSASVQMSLF